MNNILTPNVVNSKQLFQILKDAGIELRQGNISQFVKKYGISNPKSVDVEYIDKRTGTANRVSTYKNPTSFYVKPTATELKKIKEQYDINILKKTDKGPGKGDEMVEALKSPGARKSTEIIEKQIQETFPDIKLFGDETFEEILEIQRTGKHPRMKADGGRINFRTGGPTGAGSLPNIIGADLMSPGIGGLGGIEEEDEFADIRGQTAGIGLFGPISKGIQSIFGPKLGAAIFENYVRRPSINKGMETIKKANDIAYAKRMELEEKMRQAAALKAAQEEIRRMGYQDYGSGGGRDYSLNDPVTGEYTGRGDVGATTANQRGEFATDSLSYDLKDGGLATMFVERR